MHLRLDTSRDYINCILEVFLEVFRSVVLTRGRCLLLCGYSKVWHLFEARQLLEEIQ